MVVLDGLGLWKQEPWRDGEGTGKDHCGEEWKGMEEEEAEVVVYSYLTLTWKEQSSLCFLRRSSGRSEWVEGTE